MDVWTTLRKQFQVRCILTACLVGTNPHYEFDSGRAQKDFASSGDLRKGIRQRCDNTADTGTDDGISTRRCLAEVTARFEGDVKRGSARRLTRDSQGVDLGVGLAIFLMPTLADYLTVANYHGPDERIGLDSTASAFGQD
jgi:hypothetical protein